MLQRKKAGQDLDDVRADKVDLGVQQHIGRVFRRKTSEGKYAVKIFSNDDCHGQKSVLSSLI